MNAFDIPAHSIFLRPDPSKSHQQQANERMWENGSQVNHRGSKPTLGPRINGRKPLDLAKMQAMRVEGHSLRAIGDLFGISWSTASMRLREAYPDWIKPSGAKK